MAGTAIPFGDVPQVYDNGSPLSGGKVYFYVPGTSTLRTPYSDTALSVPTTNPVLLNSAGWPATNVYLDSSLAYDYIIKSADDAETLWPRTTIPANAEGSQPVDATLTALAGLSTGANKVPAFTGTDTATVLTYYPADRTITVGASGADYTTLQEAIDAIDTIFDDGQYKVTISVLAGEYTMTTQALLRSARADPIYITGAALVNLSSDFVGVTSVTSNGDRDHDVVLEITGHGLSVGDYVLIRDTTGTGAHEAFRGFFKLTAVTTDTITFNHKGKGATWVAYSVSTMEIYHMPTVLVASGSNILADYHVNRTDDPGLLEGLGGTWRIANIGLYDSSSDADAHGVISAYYGAHIQLYNYVGINGFKRAVRAVGPSPDIDCRNVLAHGCSATGFEAQRGALMLCVSCAATGCASYGFRANDGGQLDTSTCGSAMNTYNYGSSGGQLQVASSTSKDAGTYDIYATQMGHAHMVSFTGDGETRLDDKSSLMIETATIPTLTVLGHSDVHGTPSATITSKTYTLGTVEGVPYGGSYAFVAAALSSTTIASGSYVKVSPTEVSDPDSAYATGRFTAQVKGIYEFEARGTFDASEASATDAFAVIGRLKVYDNSGTSTSYRNVFRMDIAGSTKVTIMTAEGSAKVVLDVDDYVEFEFYQTSGTDQTAAGDASEWGFSGALVTGLV